MGAIALGTIDDIVRTLELAGQALKRLPPEKLNGTLQSGWPEVLRGWQDYGSDEVKILRVGPSVEQMTALERAIPWLLRLTDRERRVVVARSLGMSWRAIMRCERKYGDGLSHEGWRHTYRAAVVKIWQHAEAA